MAEDILTPLEKIKARRQQLSVASDESKSRAHRDAMINALKDNELASLLGGNKPSVVLTDQTDLGDKVKELTSKAVAAIEKLDISGLNKQQLAVLHELSTGITKV